MSGDAVTLAETAKAGVEVAVILGGGFDNSDAALSASEGDNPFAVDGILTVYQSAASGFWRLSYDSNSAAASP